MAKKEINEKTFELNITRELLDLSKSFMWYLEEAPIFHNVSRRVCLDFLNNTTFFAEGLTQQEEADTKKGGYDVSIKFQAPPGLENRLMFLQFKAGKRSKFSKTPNSLFNKSNASKRDTEHVYFTFNDDSANEQHSTLRALAKKVEIQSESVMYVFPRITEKVDFYSKIRNLLNHTSFIPVTELDRQAKLKKIEIDDGNQHKFRINYEGSESEVNLLLLILDSNPNIVNDILSELICIRIERFLRMINFEDLDLYQGIINAIRVANIKFVENYESNDNSPAEGISSSPIVTKVNEYLDQLKNSLNNIPYAPSKYTTRIPRNGLKMEFDQKIDLSKVAYQIF